jgi:hypothetical protein
MDKHSNIYTREKVKPNPTMCSRVPPRHPDYVGLHSRVSDFSILPGFLSDGVDAAIGGHLQNPKPIGLETLIPKGSNHQTSIEAAAGLHVAHVHLKQAYEAYQAEHTLVTGLLK